MTELTLNPVRTLAEATDALDFQTPLEGDDPRWEDLSPARGKNATQELLKRYGNKRPGTFVRSVLLSHRGAGKTTELKRLSRDLAQRYRCLYIAANVEMDAMSIEMEDLLLALVQQIEEFMRERVKLPLTDTAVGPVLEFFAERIKTTSIGQTYLVETSGEVEGKAELPLFGGLMFKLKSLFKQESEYRTEIKQVLRKFPGALLDAVNRLLDEANRLLREQHRQELLLVIDNLDRYEPGVADELLVKHGKRFQELRCNLIATPPIVLYYKPDSGRLEDHFEVFEMPSVLIRSRDVSYQTLEDPGRALLLKALGRRIDLPVLLPDEAARDVLVRASGGSVRELLEVAQKASLYANGTHITFEDAMRVARERRGRMRVQINVNEGWAEALAHIAEHKQPSTDEASMKVLFHRLAFMYNGEGWYDVHPEVSGLPEVEAARIRVRNALTAAG